MRFTMLIPLALMHMMKLTKRRQRAKTSGSGCRWCVGLAALSLHQMMMINQVVTEMLIGRAPPKDRHFLQAWKTNNIYNIIYDEQSKYIYIILNNGEKTHIPSQKPTHPICKIAKLHRHFIIQLDQSHGIFEAQLLDSQLGQVTHSWVHLWMPPAVNIPS